MKLNTKKKSFHSFKPIKEKNFFSDSKKKFINKSKIKIKNNRKIQSTYNKNNYKKFNLAIIALKFLLLILSLFLFIYILIPINILPNKKRVAIINLPLSLNVGNYLVKFSLFKKLQEFGLNPLIICDKTYDNINTNFLKRTINFTFIKYFSRLKESDYDYIVVNSDQTWNYIIDIKDKNPFYDIAFLKFAENWTIPKFIYGASMGTDIWFYTQEDEEIAKKLLKNFTGISFREKGMLKLVKEHLNIDSSFVLDPTMIIDKAYYLNEIKNYTPNFNYSEKFIFVYQLDRNIKLERVIKQSIDKFNYKVYIHNMRDYDFIESFIFGMNNSQSVITDSFHGTIFSIIFNKPFISFVNKKRGKGRFDSLKKVFNLENRMIDINNSNPDINLLVKPLNINKNFLNRLKIFSVNFLLKSLGIYRKSKIFLLN